MENGEVRWAPQGLSQGTSTHTLSFGLLFNFEFDGSDPPLLTEAAMDLFKPETGGDVMYAETQGPAESLSVGTESGPAVAQLAPTRPNPTNRRVSIPFSLTRQVVASRTAVVVD